MTALVIGVGNPDRSDDAVGLHVADQVRYAGPAGLRVVTTVTPTALMDLWDAQDDVVVVDCVRSGEPAGTVTVRQLGSSPLPLHEGGRSTHGFGVAEAVELARALNRLPRTLVLVGVEGADVTTLGGLTPDVAQAVGAATSAVLEALSPAR